MREVDPENSNFKTMDFNSGTKTAEKWGRVKCRDGEKGKSSMLHPAKGPFQERSKLN